MKPLRFVLWIACILSNLSAFANDGNDKPKEAKKSYTTKAVTEIKPVIDGLMNEAIWDSVEWGDTFTQREPSDGSNPSEQTAFKILYDEKNLYIGIRAFDSKPDSIVRRMSRRDGFEGDFVEVNIDSYHDLRTAFSFTVSASGVIGDEAVSNNGNNWDSNWNPIWWARTSVDDKGWTAEMRIPLSQLRFTEADELTWGLQVTRRLFRAGERSNWQYIPKDSPGWVHLFGELKGLKGIKPQKQLEVAPYVLGSMEFNEKEDGNPFATGRENKLNAGVDAKIGITSDITLDMTINPDFGQVEADPSQLNLSTFEVFFSERRPFFVEGKNVLNFRGTRSISGGSYNRDNLIYTRRIGASPSHSPDLQDNEYADEATSTPIIGAVKLSGKNKDGFAFGIMENITANTYAEIDTDGDRRKELIEPMTSYFTARATKDFNEGNSVFGTAFTSTNRFIDGEEHLQYLRKNAYSAGVDFRHNMKERKYYLMGNFMLSHVNGSQESITDTQTDFRHYYQRSTANHLSVDSTRTSLTGTGGYLKGGKGQGKWRFEAGATWRSPQLELNDAGFLSQADFIGQWAWIGYRSLNPKGIMRESRVNFNQYSDYDFSGMNTRLRTNFNGYILFKNFWSGGMGLNTNYRSISNFDLRGGPALRYPGGMGGWIWAGTDNRTKLTFETGTWRYHGGQESLLERGVWMDLRWTPMDALNVSISPELSLNDNEMQYITTIDEDTDQAKFIMGRIDQTTLSIRLRLNLILRPNLTIQYYGQPFTSKGEYSEFKEITNSMAKEYDDRFAFIPEDQITYNEDDDLYSVDRNQDGTEDYNFENPNFDFIEWRSNAVLRWEYIPGSTVFLVWQQNRSSSDVNIKSFAPHRLFGSIFDVNPQSILMLKFTYRFRS